MLNADIGLVVLVTYIIDFKLLLIRFKAQIGLSPSYISDLFTPYEPNCNLRSSGGARLAVRLVTTGDWAFAVRAPKLWILGLQTL